MDPSEPSPLPPAARLAPVIPRPAPRADVQFVLAPNRVQQEALALYRLGFNVAPTKPASKEPYLWKLLISTRVESPDRDSTAAEHFLKLFADGRGILVMAGRTSMNLAILDCESWTVARQHLEQFDKRGLHPWIVETARGAHLWFLCAEGELANLQESPQWQLWGNTHYGLVPPSVHPSGVIYQWREHTGLRPPVVSIHDLSWLNACLATSPRALPADPNGDPHLNGLSRRNRDFVTNGATDGERNSRLFAAACDYHANGFSQEEAQTTLGTAARASGLEDREIHKTIRSAYSQPRTRASTALPRVPVWRAAHEFAQTHAWPKLHATLKKRNRDQDLAISTSTARAVFIACCERARRDDIREWNQPFRASIREIAELSNTGKGIAQKALICLRENGYLQSAGTCTRSEANLYRFGQCIHANRAKGYTTPPVVECSVPLFAVPVSSVRADVFRMGGLGKLAGRLWELLLKGRRLMRTEMVKSLRSNYFSVRIALARLEKHGLAQKVGEGNEWTGIPATDDDLIAIAAGYGTAGKAAARRQGHQQERAGRVTDRLLRAIDAWERKQRRSVR